MKLKDLKDIVQEECKLNITENNTVSTIKIDYENTSDLAKYKDYEVIDIYADINSYLVISIYKEED